MEIENIEITYLNITGFREVRPFMADSYKHISDEIWSEEQIRTLIEKFPEGQVAIKVNGQMAGCALSIIVDYDKFGDNHTYEQITDNEKFSTHRSDGNMLYGIEIFIKKEFRGLRLGRRLYDYRKELCEKLNLKGIVFGGRIPNYHRYSLEYTPEEYVAKVRRKEIHDPVFDFQISNDFQPSKLIKNYLKGDEASESVGVLMEWKNIYYEKPVKQPTTVKRIVRLGLIQWQMRLYRNLDDVMEQVEYFIDTVSRYNADFVLFPEFFNAPLMSEYNHLTESGAIRELAKFTKPIVQKLSEYAVSYNINIISGSMPEMRNEGLYNAGYLCRRDGTMERYEKIHVTPDEARVWGLQGGNDFATFDTDCGKIGILICYDVEFPELSRIMADEGMNILFVPYLTDTQNAFSRVRNCAQARAIENECYVAIAGSVGNLPKVANMDIQYAQSMVFTPCDFSFPANGIKAESTPNTEMILVVDVDIDLLRELNEFGAVTNLRDRRQDIYSVKKKRKKSESLQLPG
ncbi:MAG: carbon-nitrogen hydrolase family protein [Bacteroidia bacterium]|nr:carbon-nitrogen hydrolase family protein [Bacteroidia bacterium]